MPFFVLKNQKKIEYYPSNPALVIKDPGRGYRSGAQEMATQAVK